MLTLKLKFAGLFAALVVTVSALGLNQDTATHSLSPFQDGQTVCFAGDSITHCGNYLKIIGDYYQTRYPDRKITLINCGVGGDCLPDLLARLDGDVLSHHPDWLFVMMGMNDMNRRLYGKDKNDESYGPRRKKALEQFTANLELLMQRLKKSGVKNIVIMSPTIYDEYASGQNFKENNTGADSALAAFTAVVAATAGRHNLPYIDQRTAMLEINRKQQSENPGFSLIWHDRVHPAPTGHYVIASRILAAQGQSAPQKEVEINAATLTATSPVSSLVRTDDGLAFQLQFNSLPMFLDQTAMKIPELGRFYGELNRTILKITGLKPGNYTLSINEVILATASAEQWAKGIDLAAQPSNPWFVQTMKIAELNRKRTQLEANKLRSPLVGVQILRRARLTNKTLPDDDLEAARIILAGKADTYSTTNLRRLIEDGTPEVRRQTEAEMVRLYNEIYRANHPQVLKCNLRK